MFVENKFNLINKIILLNLIFILDLKDCSKIISYAVIILIFQIKMELTQYNSNKYLQNTSSLDPLTNIFRQLKQLGSEEGDYIQIIQRQASIQYIYKITYLQEPKLTRQQTNNSLMKSMFRDSSNEANLSKKLMNEAQQKFRLSFGSQIYLKYNNLLKANILLLKPYFVNLFVQLRIEGKGYIECIDKRINTNQFEKTQSFWMCIRTPSDQSRLSINDQVYFRNFVQDQYLYMDSSGIMSVCGQQKATRFTLSRASGTNQFILEGRNILSHLIRNKSKEQIKKIIDRSIERTQSRKLIELQLEITPVSDTLIALHLQLNYSKKALEREPSLQLIQLIFSELIYYDILDFLKDKSMLSEHIQQLLLEYQILSLISTFLQNYLVISKGPSEENAQNENMLIVSKNYSQERASRFYKERDSQKRQHPFAKQILKAIGLLCNQNIQIAKIFLQLLNKFILSQQYEYASFLLDNNEFFLSQFHKANWYHHLYRIVCRSNKHQVCQITDFLCNFCEGKRQLTLIRPIIEYRHRPSTNNQYLLYHSIKSGDLFAKVFNYQLYVQGSYVFVRDNTSRKKDVELHTFIQGSSNQNSNSFNAKSQVPGHSQQQDIQLVLAQLKLIKSFCHNYNINIVLNHWPLAYGLAPYCYKENFPQISHKQIKLIIFKILIELQPSYKQAKLLTTFLVNCSLVQGQGNQRNSSAQQESKIGIQSFARNNKKRAQMSRKILKEMGNSFLKKVRQWCQSIKRKAIHITELCNNTEDNYLNEWLQIMIQVLNIRLFKVKQKKEGQLLGYLKQLFETVEKEKKKVAENQGNLMSQFVQLIIEIIKTDTKYDKYLQQIKAKRNYDGKPNQINKVISNFQSKKTASFTRTQKGLTKIQLISLVYKGLSQQQKSNLRESTRRQQQIRDEQQFKNMKLISLRLIQLVILNVNEEMVDQAVETLTYLVKNASAISNLSSFSLLDMIPKYPNQNQLKRIALQQWYLCSNCTLLNQYIEIIRLIYTKRVLYRRNINNVLLIDDESTFKIFHYIVHPVKFLKKVAANCESWLRPNLQQKYPDIYLGVDKNLQIIIECLQKLRQSGQLTCLSKIIENVDLIAILSQLIQYMAPYYLENAQTKMQKSLMFRLKTELMFVQAKLNPLTHKITQIITLYIQNRNGIDLFKSKVIMHTFGEVFSAIPQFIPLVVHIFKNIHPKDLPQLFQTVSPTIVRNLIKNYTKSCYFFQVYLYLSDEQYLRQLNNLYEATFMRFQELNQQKFIKTLCNSYQDKEEINSKNEDQAIKYEFQHSIIFMKLLLRLAYQKFHIDILYWFKDKVFVRIIQSITKSNTQNYYMIELTSHQIQRRQLITQLAFYFKEIVIPQSLSVINQVEQNQLKQFSHLIIDFIAYEHEFSRLYIEMAKYKSNQVKKLSDSTFIDYLQYLVCDLTILAHQMQFLTVGEIFDDLHECFNKLQEIYKNRVTYKSNEQTFACYSNVEKIFNKQSYGKFECKFRKINLQNMSQNQYKKHQSEPIVRKKPIRKWLKAVGELNKSIFVYRNSELIEDMLTFQDIYQLKNEAQEINLVINHKDLLLKFFQVSLNMKRIKLSMENRIFVLQNIALLAKSKHKSRQIDQGLVNYAQNLLEIVYQQQLFTDNFYHISNLYSLARWQMNKYSLALILRIIEYSKCLQYRNIWNQHIDRLIILFGLSLANYQSDCIFLQLYMSTLSSQQEMEAFQLIIPFETILSIFLKQINPISLKGETNYKYLANIILKAYLSINFEINFSFRQYGRAELLKIVESIDREVILQVYKELQLNLYYKHILLFKK